MIIESRKLTEGPGAGYTISGNITKCRLNDAKLVGKSKSEGGWFSGYEYEYEVDGTVEIENLEFYGYWDGDKISDCTADISYLSVFVDDDTEPDLQSLEDSVYPVKFSIVYGGGYSHSTFEGDIDCNVNDLSYDSIPYYEPTGMFLQITDERIVDYIDKAVTGDNWSEYYAVYDEYGDSVDAFDTEEEAIDYAKKYGYASVDLERELMDYSGDIVEVETVETVWESDEDEEDF